MRINWKEFAEFYIWLQKKVLKKLLQISYKLTQQKTCNTEKTLKTQEIKLHFYTQKLTSVDPIQVAGFWLTTWFEWHIPAGFSAQNCQIILFSK